MASGGLLASRPVRAALDARLGDAGRALSLAQGGALDGSLLVAQHLLEAGRSRSTRHTCSPPERTRLQRNANRGVRPTHLPDQRRFARSFLPAPPASHRLDGRRRTPRAAAAGSFVVARVPRSAWADGGRCGSLFPCSPVLRPTGSMDDEGPRGRLPQGPSWWRGSHALRGRMGEGVARSFPARPSCVPPVDDEGPRGRLPQGPSWWRRMGDLNPRGFYPNTISNRAH